MHDVTAHYIGKFFERKLQLDVLYGLHYVHQEECPMRSICNALPGGRRKSPTPCRLRRHSRVPAPDDGRQTFNPCPVTDYTRGGFGQYTPQRTMQRHSLGLAYVLSAGARQPCAEARAGFRRWALGQRQKFTGTDFDPRDPFSGRITWETDATGDGLRINRGYARAAAELLWPARCALRRTGRALLLPISALRLGLATGVSTCVTAGTSTECPAW